MLGSWEGSVGIMDLSDWPYFALLYRLCTLQPLLGWIVRVFFVKIIYTDLFVLDRWEKCVTNVSCWYKLSVAVALCYTVFVLCWRAHRTMFTTFYTRTGLDNYCLSTVGWSIWTSVVIFVYMDCKWSWCFLTVSLNSFLIFMWEKYVHDPSE